MGVNWTNCPQCGGELSRTAKLIPGEDVIACRDCKRYQLKGDGPWFNADDYGDIRQVLLERVEKLKTEQSPEGRYRQMIESDIDDVRWETLA